MKNITINLILIITLVIIILLFFKQCNQTNLYKAKDKQNTEALKGLQAVKLKNGQLVKERALFVKSLNELEETNKDLYNQVKLLNKEGGKVKIIYKTRIEYESPKVEIPNSVVNLEDNWKGLVFNHKTENSHISGKSIFKLEQNDNMIKIIPGKTIIDTNMMSLNLTYGVRTVNGVDKVFAISSNPNVKITDIEGFEITGKNKDITNKGYSRINLGFNLGVGALYTPDKVFFGPTLSVGVNYNLIKKK